MRLRCASFNVLADAYLSYGDYSHVAPDLLVPGARVPHIMRLIADLQADVISLQEVEPPLVAALATSGSWQLFWSQKKNEKPDGCLTLVRQNIVVTDFMTYAYSDGSDHVMQFMIIGGIAFANTHIEWAPVDDPHHSGIAQTKELLRWLSIEPPTVILADCNDRPQGPVRALVDAAGFMNVCGYEPTALIGQERAALDLIAVRGTRAEHIHTAFRPEGIPSADCPSDHIPVMAWVETD